MTDSDLQTRVVEALSPRPTQLGLDVIAYRHFDQAPVTIYTRFLGERAASVFVHHPHDERAVLDFLLELEESDLAAATEKLPVAVRSSQAARKRGFDVRIVVHPSAKRTTISPKLTPFMAAVTYLTFPAFECEFSAADTLDEARFRLAKVVPYSRWDRAPAPVISARFFRKRSLKRSLGGKWLGVFKPDELERALGHVLDEGGLVDVENYKRQLATIRVDGDSVQVAHAEGSRLIARDALLDWCRSFVSKGLEGIRGAAGGEIERRFRFAYACAVHAEPSELARNELERVGAELASVGECLPVAAAWTAARAAIFPQIEDSLVGTAVAAAKEVTWLLDAPAGDSSRTSGAAQTLNTMLRETPTDPLALRRTSAARCLAKALACCLHPSPTLFADAALAWAFAARDPADTANTLRERWTAWLDDVVTRADRFTVLEVVRLLERTLEGTLRGLVPNRYTWEGTADDHGNANVWTRDPATHKLVKQVVTYSSVTLHEDRLRVVVARDPGLVRDRLRIEYLFEHVLHRQFMIDYYWRKYRVIDYEFEDGRDRWSAPA